ncbi:hypothetical protein Tco_0527166 [Tanacetum coccineum]
MQQPMQHPEDILDPTTAIDMSLVLMANAFKLNKTTPTNNNQIISSNPRNMPITQPGMNMGQDRQMQMVGGNGGNQFRQYAGHNVRNQNGYNAVQNVGNQVDLNAVQNLNGAYNEIEEVTANYTLKDNLVEQSGGTVEQNTVTVKETRAYFESLYNNLAIEVEKVNTVNRKMKETNADLTTELATYKNQEKSKFVRDFKSLAKEADESLAKHKTLEFKIERLLRAVVSQDIMSIVQSNSAVDTSNLQTELDQCKYDKISYDKAYNDMQQKIERLQAQLGDQKGKSKDTLCVLENAYLKTTYKNMFDSITVIRTQTKTIIDSLQNKLHDTIYENAKLKAQLFDKVSEQKDTTKGTSANTKFANQSTLGTKLYYVTPLPKSKVIPKCVNSMKSRQKNQHVNFSKSANEKKHKANVKKSKKLDSENRLASSRPSKPRTCLKWLPTGRIFDLSGTITESSNTESEFDTFVFDTASASNPQEPTNKGFPSSTFFLGRFSKLQRQNSCIYPLAIL